MAKQVDFYLIQNAVSLAKYTLASRLANKLIALQQTSLIITDDETSLRTLDEVMWSFKDSSFVAHDCLSNDQTTIAAPHCLCTEAFSTQIPQLDYFDVLINLASSSNTLPLVSHHFDRIVETVETDEVEKSSARQRYSQYQAEGFKMHTHKVEL